EELIEFTTPTHRVWVTGGPSSGDPAGDLVDPATYLAEAGTTDAAGFEGYTEYVEIPIGSRKLGFTAGGRRLTRFGIAAGHAAEQAAGMDHPAPGSPAQDWLAACLGELDVREESDQGRALLRFAARGLALSVWRKHPDVPPDPDLLDDCARELARVADEFAL